MTRKPKAYNHGCIMLAVNAVSDATGVPVPDILGKQGDRQRSDARFMAMSLAKSINKRMPNAEIAWVFNRDVSMVSYAIKKTQDYQKVDRSFQAQLEKAALIIQSTLNFTIKPS